LRACFLRFVEEGGRTNLQRWSQAVEKSACRAGLLLCNDALVACDTLKGEEGGFGELSKDLIAFVTSERYFALRNELGIAISQN
jgi:golgin subfamily B member 1